MPLGTQSVTNTAPELRRFASALSPDRNALCDNVVAHRTDAGHSQTLANTPSMHPDGRAGSQAVMTAGDHRREGTVLRSPLYMASDHGMAPKTRFGRLAMQRGRAVDVSATSAPNRRASPPRHALESSAWLTIWRPDACGALWRRTAHEPLDDRKHVPSGSRTR